ILALSQVLRPGVIDVADGVRPANPTGIAALGGVLDAIQLPLGLCLLALGVAAIVSVVIRFRPAPGEGRQQLRWLVFVVMLGLILLVCTVITGIGIPPDQNRPLNDVFFLATFAAMGIGVPVAMAIAILRFHLYDLELVIKKTLVFGILVASITGLAVLG